MNKKQLTITLMFVSILMAYGFNQIIYAGGLSNIEKVNQKVFVEKGNIYYSADGKNKTQLTKNGKDRSPVLSPDGKYIIFIRKSDKEAYLSVGSPEDYLQSGPDGILADQIWIVGIDGRSEKMLARDNKPDVSKGHNKWKCEDIIAHIDDDSLKFSPNSKTVYFISSAWVTTGGLHSVNIDGTNGHFVTSANTLDRILDKGDYKGCLVISQHRYFIGGGSYDWYYVFTPDGKEVGPLGDDLNTVDWDMLYFDSKKE